MEANETHSQSNTFTPVNTKSLFAFICMQMNKLDKNEISWQQAKAQAMLCNQANKILEYELKRSQVQLLLQNTNIRIKEVESKIVEYNEKQ